MTLKPDLTRTWAATAPGGNVVDPDVTTPGKFTAGWVAEVPPFEHFNYLQQLFSQGLAHANEQGIMSWDTDTLYPVDGMAKGASGKSYIARVAQSGNDPDTDGGVNWRIAIDNVVRRINVADYGAIGDGSDETVQISAAITAWNDLLSGGFGGQYPSDGSVALYFPAGRWYAPGLNIAPDSTGGMVIGDGINSQLEGMGLDFAQYRCGASGMLLRGTGDFGIRMSDDSGSGPKGIQIHNMWIRDKAIGLELDGVFAWDNLVNIYVEKCDRNVSLIETSGLNLTNVISVSPNVDHAWYIEGGAELKCVNCLGMDSPGNNLYIMGSTAKTAIEHYFSQCTFTGAQRTRLFTISNITDAGGGQIDIEFSAAHELVANMEDLIVTGTTNYNATYDVDSIVSTTVIRVTATYVSDETSGSANLPNWDVFIDVNGGDPIIRTNDMFFEGGNMNYTKINRGFNINFNGTRLKTQVWLGEVNRVKIDRNGRGRSSGITIDIPIGGAITGWSEVVYLDNGTTGNPGDGGMAIRTPSKANGLIGNVASVLNTVTVLEDKAILEAEGRFLEVNSEGVQVTNIYSDKINIADDDVYVFSPMEARGTIRVGQSSQLAQYHGWLTYRADGGFGGTQSIAVGSDVDSASGVLGGTTGTDGKLTISADTSGNIYIENRTGSAANFFYTLEGGV